MLSKIIITGVVLLTLALPKADAEDKVESFRAAFKIMEDIAIRKSGIDQQGNIDNDHMNKIKAVLVFVEGELAKSAACAAPAAAPSGAWKQEVTCEWRCVRVGRRCEWRQVRSCRWVYVEEKEKTAACAAAPKQLWDTTKDLMTPEVIADVLASKNDRSGYDYALQVLAVVLSADTDSRPGHIAK